MQAKEMREVRCIRSIRVCRHSDYMFRPRGLFDSPLVAGMLSCVVSLTTLFKEQL